jgi:AcrR family transcriptional regulator
MEKRTGRDRQKQRTRNAIVAAARALVEHGRLPSVAEVAEAALVSPATAYRYFPDQLSLLQAALGDGLPRPDDLVASIPDDTTDPVERAARVAEALQRFGLQREALVRAVIALSLLRSIDGTATREEATRLRPGYRLAPIEEALRPLEGTVAPEALARLRAALAVVISGEALVALQDVVGLDPETAVAVCVWATRTLVRAVAGDESSIASRR